MPDAHFEHPRLVELYDRLEGERPDLDVYDAVVDEFGATLRFRERDEVERDLRRHGYVVEDVRDAPDRPGLELVFVTARGRPPAGADRRPASRTAPGRARGPS